MPHRRPEFLEGHDGFDQCLVVFGLLKQRLVIRTSKHGDVGNKGQQIYILPRQLTHSQERGSAAFDGDLRQIRHLPNSCTKLDLKEARFKCAMGTKKLEMRLNTWFAGKWKS